MSLVAVLAEEEPRFRAEILVKNGKINFESHVAVTGLFLASGPQSVPAGICAVSRSFKSLKNRMVTRDLIRLSEKWKKVRATEVACAPYFFHDPFHGPQPYIKIGRAHV